MRQVNRLLSFSLHAADGPIGGVHDVYFDDHQWIIRYVAADTRRWLPERRVLISPVLVRGIDWRQHRLDIGLTKERIRNSPDIDTDKPVFRQHEVDYYDYLAFPYFGIDGGLWSAVPLPASFAISELTARSEQDRNHPGDPHLRSARFVVGHTIQASDAEIGHVEDFLFDESSWEIRYLVVDTRNWWPGKRVLLPSACISRVSWLQLSVHVDLPSEAIRRAPPYDPWLPFTAEDEVRLSRYYGLRFISDHTASLVQNTRPTD